MDDKPHTILAEFQKRGDVLRLFAVRVFEDLSGHDHLGMHGYDVEFSRSYGYMFDMSSFGGSDRKVEVSGIYFCDGPVKVEIVEKPTDLISSHDQPPYRSAATKRIRELNRTRRLRQLPKQFRYDDGGDLMAWLHRHAIEQDSVWCSKCRDRMPGDDLCQHVRWCDQTGWYVTPDDDCSKCIGGKCKDRFDLTPHVSPHDGALWMWAGEPELSY